MFYFIYLCYFFRLLFGLPSPVRNGGVKSSRHAASAADDDDDDSIDSQSQSAHVMTI